jgi:chitodextrinase
VHFGRISGAGATEPTNFHYETTLPEGTTLIPAGTTSFTISGLEENSTYYFAVTAIDLSGNQSAYSAEASAHVPDGTNPPPDTTPPTMPTALQASEVTPQSVTLAWQASTDNVGVTGYQVFQDGVMVATVASSPWQVTGLQEQSTYIFTVSAVDAAGNMSSPSAPLPVATPAIPDTTPPSTPSNLTSADLTATSVTLRWGAATDNVGVTGYRVYVNDTSHLSTSTTQQALAGLTPGATYTLAVSAVDAAGNESTQRAALTITTLDGAALPPLDTSPPPNHSRLLVEFGEITLDHTWTSITFDQSFVAPIVVATPVSQHDAEAVVLQIRNVYANGFDIRLQEWNAGDATHGPEVVSYVVMERGSYTLPDGTRVEAGLTDTAMTTEAEVVSFAHAFADPPIVLASIVSVQEADVATTRVQQITAEGFALRLQEQEGNVQAHSTERVAYLAWQLGSGTADDVQFEAGRTEAVVQHEWYPLMFQSTYAHIPAFVAAMQTFNGSDPAVLRWQNKDGLGIDVRVAEEVSADSETEHVAETVGYLLLTRREPEIDTPPTLHIVTPTDNSVVTEEFLVQIDATDEQDALGTLTVDVSIDQGEWQPATYNSTNGFYELWWESATVPAGTFDIEARAIDTAQNMAHAIPVTVSVAAPSMHVGDLDGEPRDNGRTWTGIVTITVHDAMHQPVANATVHGSWRGGYADSDVCITDQTGQCRMQTGAIKKRRRKWQRSVTFTVSTISHEAHGYHPADNHDVDGESDGTTLTVFRP